MAVEAKEESPEALFRAATASWQSPAAQRANDWSAWHTLSEELWRRFDNDKVDEKNRLELVGAMEESILAIEQTVFGIDGGSGGGGGGSNAKRDIALAVLYTTYAKALYHLSPTECHSLAHDPHTLLIGADTIQPLDSSSSEQRHPLCVENAENSLRNAASLDATNTETDKWLQVVLNKVGGDDDNEGGAHQRKPKEFVAELFDSFADTFDDKLLKGLDYKVPALVGNLARNLTLEGVVTAPKLYHTVLDAGCGTGLAGRYLRPLMDPSTGFLVGVDASQKMLDKAAQCTRTHGCGLETKETNTNDKYNDDHRPLYDHLTQMDLEEMTLNSVAPADKRTRQHPVDVTVTTTGFDLIVAADVLVYFGTLEALLRTFGQLSIPGVTRLIFSCELAEPAEAPLGWRLLPSGRFAHTQEHALASAQKAGYVLRHYQEIVPRMEKGEPVRGHLFAFEFQSSQPRQQREHDVTNQHQEEL